VSGQDQETESADQDEALVRRGARCGANTAGCEGHATYQESIALEFSAAWKSSYCLAAHPQDSVAHCYYATGISPAPLPASEPTTKEIHSANFRSQCPQSMVWLVSRANRAEWNRVRSPQRPDAICVRRIRWINKRVIGCTLRIARASLWVTPFRLRPLMDKMRSPFCRRPSLSAGLPDSTLWTCKIKERVSYCTLATATALTTAITTWASNRYAPTRSGCSNNTTTCWSVNSSSNSNRVPPRATEWEWLFNIGIRH